MTGITVTTHRATATTAFGSRRVYAALAGWVLLMVALFTALLLAMQSGQHTLATAVLTQEVVQQDRGTNQAPEPGSVRGRPY